MKPVSAFGSWNCTVVKEGVEVEPSGESFEIHLRVMKLHRSL
jgi:hypothetical protein